MVIPSTRNLGITISSDLSWSNHISNIVKRARSLTSWVLNVFRTREKSVMLTLYKSLIRSILEFSCPLWHPVKIREIHMLEGVQRTFTHMIAGSKDSNYWNGSKRCSCCLYSVGENVISYSSYGKSLHNVTLNDVGMTFLTSTRNGTAAVVPSLTKGSSQRNHSLYDSSFAVLGPRLWNTVPSNIKSLDKFDNFKESLSGFLSKFSDEPPTQGYTCSNSNSIVDWTGSRWL